MDVGSDSDFKELNGSVVVLVSGLDVVGLLWGRLRDEGGGVSRAIVGVLLVPGEELGEDTLFPESWPETIFGGDFLSLICFESSFRQLSYGLKLDLGATGDEPFDEDEGDDLSLWFLIDSLSAADEFNVDFVFGESEPIWLHVWANKANGLFLASNCNRT